MTESQFKLPPNAGPVERFWTLLPTLAEMRGLIPLSKAGPIWEFGFQVVEGRDWLLVSNTGSEPVAWHEHTIPPWTVHVRYNGWPAALIDPAAVIMVNGRECSIETLLDDFEAYIKSEKEKA